MHGRFLRDHSLRVTVAFAAQVLVCRSENHTGRAFQEGKFKLTKNKFYYYNTIS